MQMQMRANTSTTTANSKRDINFASNASTRRTSRASEAVTQSQQRTNLMLNAMVTILRKDLNGYERSRIKRNSGGEKSAGSSARVEERRRRKRTSRVNDYYESSKQRRFCSVISRALCGADDDKRSQHFHRVEESATNAAEARKERMVLKSAAEDGDTSEDAIGVSQYDVSNDESDFLQQAGIGSASTTTIATVDDDDEDDDDYDRYKKKKKKSGSSSSCHGHSHGGLTMMNNDDELNNFENNNNKKKNRGERVLDIVLTKSKLNEVAGYLRGRGTVTVFAWCLMLIAGFCHVSQSICSMLNVALIVPTQVSAIVATTATALVYVFAGTPEFVDVLYELVRGNINVHVLTTLAVFGTVLLGCAFEGALLLVLFASAHYVEDRLTQHARGDLKALWKTVPPFANIVDVDEITNDPIEGSQRKMRASEVPVGSFCFVKAGTQVPLDGIVVHGSARVSIQHITGEALPVKRRIGDEIPAGAMNIDGVLVVKSSESSENSTPARIAKLTERAQQRKPRVSRLIDDVGDKYSKIILFITFLTMVTAPIVLGVPFLGRGGAMYRSFAFLSAAAPCALLMSPLVYVAAIGAMARRGILIRGGRTLDALANVNLVCLDKTGTLTSGEMSIAEVKDVQLAAKTSDDEGNIGRRSNDESISIAKALERGSVHPIAKATINHESDNNSNSSSSVTSNNNIKRIESFDVKNYKVEHGKGVEGEINGELYRFGTASWALECRTVRGGEEIVSKSIEEGHRSAGEAIAVLCSASSTDATIFRFSDAPREEAKAAVATLKRRGQIVRMLTGDATASALAIAEQVGIEPAAVFSQMTPDAKLAHIETARENGKKMSVAMIGDGINDAPALAAADVGIAVCSTPSDAASAAADVLLLQTGQGQLQSKDRQGTHGTMSVISAVPELFALGRMTRNILRQNIILAICSILGAALPALFGAFPLWLAVCIHEGATLLVAANSIRLLATFGPRNSMQISKRAKFLIAGLTAVAVSGALATFYKPQGVLLQTFVSDIITSAVAETSMVLHSLLHPALKSAWAGLLAGGLHTLTGADHLAALTPLSVGPSRAKNALLGALWGFGHNTGQIIFGLLFMLLRNRIPWNTEIIGQWGQAIVGLTLIFIGCLGFWEQIGGGHGHTHSHGGHSHSHSHYHSPTTTTSEEESSSKKIGKFSPLRLGSSSEASRISWTYITGTIHGLQPDSLFLLLPALTLPKIEAYSFLGAFFFGTIVAMGGYTAFLGAGTTLLEKENPQMVKYIGFAASSIAFALGLVFVLSSVFPALNLL